MKEVKLIDFLRAELNSFSGEQISIEDCNRITLRLWKMSNSNFKLCSEAINNLKSTSKKIISFKNHSLAFLFKLFEKSGNRDFQYKLRTSNKTLSNNKNTFKSKTMLNKITSKLFLLTSMFKSALRRFGCFVKKYNKLFKTV